jgi:hypothetical protein
MIGIYFHSNTKKETYIDIIYYFVRYIAKSEVRIFVYLLDSILFVSKLTLSLCGDGRR